MANSPTLFLSLAGFLFVSCGANAEEKNWHLLTVSKTGSVSLINGLSSEECTYALKRVQGLPTTPAEETEGKKLFERGIYGMHGTVWSGGMRGECFL